VSALHAEQRCSGWERVKTEVSKGFVLGNKVSDRLEHVG